MFNLYFTGFNLNLYKDTDGIFHLAITYTDENKRNIDRGYLKLIIPPSGTIQPLTQTGTSESELQMVEVAIDRKVSFQMGPGIAYHYLAGVEVIGQVEDIIRYLQLESHDINLCLSTLLQNNLIKLKHS